MCEDFKDKLGLNISIPHLNFTVSEDVKSVYDGIESISTSLTEKFSVQVMKDFENVCMSLIKDMAIKNGFSNLTLLNEKAILDLFMKGTSKAPITKEDSFGDRWLVCPSCGNNVTNVWSRAEYKPNYCHYCGQRYDWEE